MDLDGVGGGGRRAAAAVLAVADWHKSAAAKWPPIQKMVIAPLSLLTIFFHSVPYSKSAKVPKEPMIYERNIEKKESDQHSSKFTSRRFADL